jgi:hypothetical protein
MAAFRRQFSLGLLASVVVLATPLPCRAQASAPTPASSALTAALMGTDDVADGLWEAGPWEVTLEGRIGFPVGHLQVVDRPTLGTRFRLSDLGIHVSEALEGSGAFYFTPRDAVRGTFLYYFLRGSSTQDRTVGYNGTLFGPGPLDANADFYRLSLDYERVLLSRPSGERLIGSAGLTYDVVYPRLTGSGQSNAEPFGSIGFRTQIPVPILGLRWDQPLAPNVLLRTSLSGGGLPRVNSLRKEESGHTLYLEQAHADLGAGLVYLFGRGAQIEGGYHFTYFRMRETSVEDLNLFELIDNGVYARFILRF